MNKLKLNLDELSVESFDTMKSEKTRGTVVGEQCTCYTYCDTCPGCPTCDASCNGTCDASCNGTCYEATCVDCGSGDYTCDGYCTVNDYTCNGYGTCGVYPCKDVP